MLRSEITCVLTTGTAPNEVQALFVGGSNYGKGGLFRSLDGGDSFQVVSDGLPAGDVTDLAMGAGKTLYAGIAGKGVFQSAKDPNSWSKWSDLSGVLTSAEKSAAKIRFSAHQSTAGGLGSFALYAGFISEGGELIGLARYFAPTWEQLTPPPPSDLNPGKQGLRHFSILADAANRDILYLGGDYGKDDYNGSVLRGRVQDPGGGVEWVSLTSSGANNTAPHADSRQLVMVGGNLLEATDGGIYRLNNPENANTRKWASLNGDLRVSEVLSVAYDPVNNRILAGLQDNGSVEQFQSDSKGTISWRDVAGGDGNTQGVAVKNAGSNVDRYSLENNFKYFIKRTFDRTDKLIASKTVDLKGTGLLDFSSLSGLGEKDKKVDGFYQIPFVINRFNPSRLVIGLNGLYESFNGGDTIAPLIPSADLTNVKALAYGGRKGSVVQEDVLYVSYVAGFRPFVSVRESVGSGFGRPIQMNGLIEDFALDPDDWKTAFAVTSSDLLKTTDGGTSWKSILSASPGSPFQSVEIIKKNGKVFVLIGTNTGVIRGIDPAPGSKWERFGLSLPTVPVTDLLYDAGKDLLIAGTLGRGVWSLPKASLGAAVVGSIAITGTPGNDQILLSRNADNPRLLDVTIGDKVLFSKPLDVISRIDVIGTPGADVVTVDSTHGAITVFDGIYFDGGASLTNKLITKGPAPAGESMKPLPDGWKELTIRQSDGIQVVRWRNLAPDGFDNQLPAPRADVLGALREGMQVFDQKSFSPTNPALASLTVSPFQTLYQSVIGGRVEGTAQPIADPVGLGLPASEEPATLESTGLSLLARLFTDGADQMLFQEIGNSISSLDQLRSRLDALDQTPGNVTITDAGGVTRVDLRVTRSLSGVVPFRIAQAFLDSALDLNGVIRAEADVALHIRFGVDEAGFFIEPTESNDPEVIVGNFRLSGNLDGSGRVGFLSVDLSDFRLTTAPGLGFSLKLTRSPASTNSVANAVRLDDLFSSDGLAITASVRGDPTADDLTIVAAFSVAASIDSSDPLFTIADAQIEFVWADINDPFTIRVTARTSAGGGLLNFLNVHPTEILNQIGQYCQYLDQFRQTDLFQTKLPFAGDKTIGELLDFKAGLSKILDGLQLDKLIPSFSTLQELVVDLDGILGLPAGTTKVGYDLATQSFTFGLNFKTTLAEVSLPFDLGTKLGPLVELTTDGQAKLSADLALNFVLGIDTRPLGAVLRANGAAPANGRLSKDAIFTLGVGASQPVKVTVKAAATNGTDGTAANQSLDDLVTDVNAALTAVQVGDKAKAGRDGDKLTLSLTSTSAAPSLKLIAAATDPTVTEMQFSATQTASGSVADLFFIKSGLISGTLKLSAEQVNAEAKFGDFVDVQIVNASGEAKVSLAVEFKENDPNGDGRITLSELLDNFTSLSKYVTLQLTGSANLKLPIEVNPNLFGNAAAGQAALLLDWPEIFDPGTLKVTTQNLDALLDLEHFDITRLFDALQSLSDYLSKMDGFSFLKEKLPLANKSITELLGMAGEFASALQSFRSNPARSLQFVETKIEQLFRLPDDAVTLTMPTKDELKLSLLFKRNFTLKQNIDLDLADLVNVLAPGDPARGFLSTLSSIVQVSGSGQLGLDLDAVFQLDLGFDLTNDPAKGDLAKLLPFLYDTSKFKFTAKAGATNIQFDAVAGPLPLKIKGGSAQILRDCQPGATAPAEFVLTLKNSDGDGRHLLSQLDLDALDVSVNAGICAKLPVYFPTESTLLGNIEFTINSLPDFFNGEANSVVLKLPDFSQFLQNFDFLDNLDLIIDGLDYVLAQVQAGLDSGVFNIDLPLIGDQLSKAADQGVHFIGNIRNGILTELKQNLAGGVTKGVAFVRGALLKALGPTGLGLLDDIESVITKKNGITDSVQFNLVLRKSVDVFKTTVGFDIGVPALGLAVNGGVLLSLDFQVVLRFGVSRDAGFYLDTSVQDEIKVGIKASTPNLKATGRLGFLQVDVTDDAKNPSKLEVDFTIDIKNPKFGVTGPQKDRLTFDDIIRTENIEEIFAVDFKGVAAVSLGLLTSFGADANFPSIRAKFKLDWTISSADNFRVTSPTIAFNDIELNLGEFVNKFALPILAKVQEVLAPVKPILDFLATRIPVISDLKGLAYTIGDMLLDSGGVKESTKLFIHQAHNLADLFLAMKNIGKMEDYWFPLGSFNSGTSDVKRSTDPNRFNKTDTLAPSADRVGNAPKPIVNFITSTRNLDEKGGGFKFPIFEDPKILFQLLLGKDVSLVEYKMPTVQFDAGFEFSYPIYGYLMLFFRGAFGAKVNLSFGYDTHGLREFIDSKDPVDLLYGFYVNDGESVEGRNTPPIVNFYARIAVGIKVEVAGAGVGISGGFWGDFNIGLNDPNKDGRVHVDEFIENLTAEGDLGKKLICTFRFTGKITFGLTLFVTAGPFRAQLDFATVDLFKFDSNATSGCDDFISDRFDKGNDLNGKREKASDIGVSPGQHLTGLNMGLGSDIDIYKFELVRPDSVDVKTLFRHGAGEISFQVTDAKKKLLGKSQRSTDGAYLSLHDLKPGIYYVQVRGPKRGQRYDLAITPASESGTHVYYVNDNSIQDQYYALTLGNDSNDGLSPKTPKATVQSILDAYELHATDLVAIDTGQYSTTTTVSAADGEVLYAGTPGKSTFKFDTPSFDVTGSGGNIFYRLSFTSASTTGVAIQLRPSGDVAPRGNEIRKNTFSGGAIAVKSTAGNLLIEDNIIENTSGTALLLAETAIGTFRRNQITVRSGKGIQIEGTGESVLIENTIKHTTLGGILLLNQARGTLKNNRLDLEEGEGIAVMGAGDTLLEKNIVTESTGTAVRLGSGNYTLRNNDLFGHSGTGIRVEGGGTLAADNSFITGADVVGIHLLSAASSKLRGNLIGIYGTAQGIRAETGSHQIDSNTVAGAGTYGIYLLANVTLAQPMRANTLRLSGATHGIQIDTTQPVEVEGNILGAFSAYGIYIPSSTAATVRNNQIAIAGAAEGIHLDKGSNTVEGNTIIGRGTIGVWLTADATGPITGNIIDVKALTQGIRYDSTQPADIEKNVAGTASVFGIYLPNAATSKILDNTVTLAGTAIGIRFDKGTGQIDSNTILGTGDYGIYLSSTVRVSEGVIRNNKVHNAANHSGIRLDSADPVTMEGNDISGPKLYGIFLPASVSSTIRKNMVATGYGGTPIRIEAGVNLIEENIIKVGASTNFGIDLAKTAYGTLRGNTVTGGGIRLVFSADNVIENNRISGSGNGFNIHMLDAAGGRVSGNVLRPGTDGGSGGGILVTGVVKMSIDNNQIDQAGTAIRLTKTVEATIRGNHITASDIGISIETGNTVIEDNVIEDRAEFGIFLDENDRPHTNLIRGNVIRSAGGSVGNYGIYILSGDNVVENNTVEATLDGMIIGSKTFTIIRSNKVLTHKRGIRVLIGPNQLVENNTVTGVDNAKAHGDGVEVTFQNTGISSIVRQNEVTGFLRGINTNPGVNVRGNRVHDNATGVFNNGIFGSPDGSEMNDIYANDVGVNSFNDGTVLFNRIHDNRVGIVLGLRSKAHHNEIFRNTETGVLIADTLDADLFSNTIAASGAQGIRVIGGSDRLRIRNNIVSFTSGYGIVVDVNLLSANTMSIDYNLYYPSPTGAAKIGSWNKKDGPTLAQWQAVSGRDGASLVADPQFSNPAADDYSLKAGSPAIDHADAWYSPRQAVPGDGRVDDVGTKNTGRNDYLVTDLGRSLFAASGISQKWKSDDTYWGATLGFTFPFFDATFTGISVTTEGAIVFPNSRSSYEPNNSIEKLLADRIIAPLWDNLRTTGTGDDIFTDATVPGQFTVRWNATSAADGSDVNFSVTLFQDGRIRFDYGSGNTNLTPTIGISRGNGIAYALSPGNGAASLAGANSVEFVLRPSYVDIGAREFGDSVTINGGSVQRSTASALDVSFGQNVASSLGLEDFVLKNQTTGTVISTTSLRLQYDAAANRANLTFPGLLNGRLADGDYELTVLAAGITGPDGRLLDTDVRYRFRILHGDANGDGVVNERDLLRVWQDLSKPVNQRNSNNDLNGDGLVNNDDLELVRSSYLTPRKVGTGLRSLAAQEIRAAQSTRVVPVLPRSP